MKNKYKIENDTVIIYLNKRNGNIYETLIDLDDFETISNWKYKWNASFDKCVNNFYAATTEYCGVDENGKSISRKRYLHNFLYECPKGYDVDHINHNTLDNRKSNLRLVKHELNNKHRKGKNKNNTSGYRNVSWDGYKWMVQLQIEGRNNILGRFDDVHEAGKYAEEMRNKYYGEFAGAS